MGKISEEEAMKNNSNMIAITKTTHKKSKGSLKLMKGYVYRYRLNKRVYSMYFKIAANSNTL